MDAVRYSVVRDGDTLAKLNGGRTIRAYRAMQLVNGRLYPPMAAKVDGKWQEPAEIGEWLQADERPDLVDGRGHFKLNKGNGSTIRARYNPYWHTSLSMLNDQFSSAKNRPNLVTVEVEVPEAELTSGYRAKGAKDAVGKMKWHSGPVSSRLAKLGSPREVILSRWCRVVRIVQDAEVADAVARQLDGTGIAVLENTVTPSLYAELRKHGVATVTQGGETRHSVRRDELALRDDPDDPIAKASVATYGKRPAARLVAFADALRRFAEMNPADERYTVNGVDADGRPVGVDNDSAALADWPEYGRAVERTMRLIARKVLDRTAALTGDELYDVVNPQAMDMEAGEDEYGGAIVRMAVREVADELGRDDSVLRKWTDEIVERARIDYESAAQAATDTSLDGFFAEPSYELAAERSGDAVERRVKYESYRAASDDLWGANQQGGEFGTGADIRYSVKIVPVEGVKRDDAVASLNLLKGKAFTNRETGIEARLSSTGAGKLVSNKAVAKSVANGFTPAQHNALAAQIDRLYEGEPLAGDALGHGLPRDGRGAGGRPGDRHAPEGRRRGA